MMKVFVALKRQWLEALLATALGALWLQLYVGQSSSEHNTLGAIWDKAESGAADLSLRNADFPNTYIRSIHLDLTSPNHWVRLTWSGPEADSQDAGPFPSSPGNGRGANDCNDVAESNRSGSRCTPKGTTRVEAFGDHLPSTRIFKFATWIDTSRGIAFHSHPDVPDYPASDGCVRLSEHAAQLIHNNAVVGKTDVIVGGTWSRPPTAEP